MDFATPIIKVGGNPDDGILLGGSVTFTKYGFKKDPYASVQTFSGDVALETGAFALRYSGEFIDVFNKWEFLLDVELRGPLYARNYYGLGNETLNDEEALGDDFHRVRHRFI